MGTHFPPQGPFLLSFSRALLLLAAEVLQGAGVLGAFFFDGLLQQHVLHLYGVSGLASPNLSQAVPFIKVFLPLRSQTVTGFPTCSQAESGKSTVWPGSLFHQLPGHTLML